MFMFGRRKRQRFGALGLGLALLALPVRAEEKPKLAFAGLTSTSIGINQEVVRSLSEYVQTRLTGFELYRVTGSAEIAALIGVERQKQMLGCSDEGCAVELAGALDTDRILSGTLSKLGDTYILNLSLVDSRKGVTIHRTGARLKGQSIDVMLDQIDPKLLELVQHDPLVKAPTQLVAVESPPAAPAAPAAAAVPAAPPVAVPDATVETRRSWHLVAGLRVEGDFIGLANGAPAIAPALSVSFTSGRIGAAAALIIAPIPGVRAEARFVPFEDSKVRPHGGVGVVLFGGAFGIRGCLGLGGTIGSVHLFGDAGIEGFLTGANAFNRVALLVALGAGYEF
jgi:hypothetical protein